MAEQPDWLKLPSDLLEHMARRTRDAVMGVATLRSGSTAALPNLNAVRDSSAASEITHLGYEHTPDHEEPNLNTVPDGGAASEITHLAYEHAPDHEDPNLNAVHDGSATSEVAHLGYEQAPDHEEAPTDGMSDLEAAADNHLQDEESETEVEDGLSDLKAAADNHLEDEESETEVEDGLSDLEASVDNYLEDEESETEVEYGLSDLEASADNYLEDEESETEVEEKKYSKKEMLKRDADRKKQYMTYALQKYNNDEDLAEEKRFVFEESKDEVFIIEGNMNFYEHFNFTAKQAGSSVLFFAEVIPDEGELCDVLCCKPLDSDDNGHCFGCKNQGSVDLRHPAGESLYVGGHVDCGFPFMWDSISEDDSD